MKKLFLAAVLFILGACVSTGQEKFHRVIHLKDVEIHVVSDREMFDYLPYTPAKSGFLKINGYAYVREGKIYVLGHHDGYGIALNSATLGHEIWHLMAYRDGELNDPDTGVPIR